MIIIQANGAEGDLEEKILALLRREDIAAERVSLSSRHTLTFPELTIDGRSQQAFQNGTALALTRIEFNMLLLLASNPGVTLSKEDLFSAVWGRDSADTLKVVANTRIRKDSVVCIDTIITSGPGFFEGMPHEKIREFFAAGCDFMAQKVGLSNIISAVVHMDEKTPHLHMVFVPITSDGRLSAKDIIGGKKDCVAWQNEFFDCMSARFPELSRGRSVEETGHKHIEMSELRKSNKMNGIVNELEKSIDSTHPLNVPAQKKKLRKLTQELYPLGRDIEITVANIQEQAREAEERAAAAMQNLSREAEMQFAIEAKLKSVREQAEVEKREIKEKASYEKEHLEAMNCRLKICT